jgi:hypothetical protein
MQKPLTWILPVLLLPLSGCLATLMGTKDTHSRSYRIPEPGVGWEAIDPGQADRAYRNTRDQAILNVTSVCGETSYKPLEQLSTDILRQLPEHEVVEPPQPAVVNGHPALITEAQGQVDGKPLKVRVAVVRTPNCLFDFILAGSQLDPSSRIAFEQSLQGFREKAR